MAKQIKDYLIAASKGFPKGYKTFFTPEEASKLLIDLENILAGDNSESSNFYSKLHRRVDNKRAWVSTG